MPIRLTDEVVVLWLVGLNVPPDYHFIFSINTILTDFLTQTDTEVNEALWIHKKLNSIILIQISPILLKQLIQLRELADTNRLPVTNLDCWRKLQGFIFLVNLCIVGHYAVEGGALGQERSIARRIDWRRFKRFLALLLKEISILIIHCQPKNLALRSLDQDLLLNVECLVWAQEMRCLVLVRCDNLKLHAISKSLFLDA